MAVAVAVGYAVRDARPRRAHPRHMLRVSRSHMRASSPRIVRVINVSLSPARDRHVHAAAAAARREERAAAEAATRREERTATEVVAPTDDVHGDTCARPSLPRASSIFRSPLPFHTRCGAHSLALLALSFTRGCGAHAGAAAAASAATDGALGDARGDARARFT